MRGKRGRPRRRPDTLYADRAYDSARHWDELRAQGINPHIAERGTGNGSGLGVIRWVVERTIAWYHGMRVFYAGTGDGSVVCVNARTGEPIWRVSLFRAGINATVIRGNQSVQYRGVRDITSK